MNGAFDKVNSERSILTAMFKLLGFDYKGGLHLWFDDEALNKS